MHRGRCQAVRQLVRRATGFRRGGRRRAGRPGGRPAGRRAPRPARPGCPLLPALLTGHPAEDAAERPPIPPDCPPAAAPLRAAWPGSHDDRREDRQELAHQVRGGRAATGGAELADDLPALVAEHVADDPVAVVLVDVVEVHPAPRSGRCRAGDDGGEGLRAAGVGTLASIPEQAGSAWRVAFPVPSSTPRRRRGRSEDAGQDSRRRSWTATLVGRQPHDRATDRPRPCS